MRKIVWSLFILSLSLMAWWVFFWPLIFPEESYQALLQFGALATLVLFLAMLAVLITLRIRTVVSKRPLTSG